MIARSILSVYLLLTLNIASCFLARNFNQVVCRWNVGLRSSTSTVDFKEREFQLEELEDKDSSATSLVLHGNGSITLGETEGPLPSNSFGSWSMEDSMFKMSITREFDAVEPYQVERTYIGEVEEVLAESDVVVLSGEIFMNDFTVGYFKMISNPADIYKAAEEAEKRIKRLNIN